MPEPSSAPRKIGLALTSLALGVLVWTLALWCFPARLWYLDPFVLLACLAGCLAFPPAAVVCGHTARSRARRWPEQYGGRGLALAGLILGYSGVIVWLAFAPLSRLECCRHDVKSLALACKMYCSDSNEHFPPDFATLFRLAYHNAPKVYVCPSSSSTPVSCAEELDDPAHCDYIYFGGGWTEAELGADAVLIIERAGNHFGFRNVAFGDAHVEQAWSWPGADVPALVRKHGWILLEHRPDLRRSDTEGASGVRRN